MTDLASERASAQDTCTRKRIERDDRPIVEKAGREGLGELEDPRLVAPEERDVIGVENPGEREKDDGRTKGPQKQEHGESA